MKSGIYRIKNIVNGKLYVGSSKNVYLRLGAHKSNLRRGKGFKKLQADFDKYGEENFLFDVIELVKDETLLESLEDACMKKYNTIEDGYNIRPAKKLGSNDVTTVITDKLLEKIKSLSKEEKITRSAWVRKAITEKVERDENNG